MLPDFSNYKEVNLAEFVKNELQRKVNHLKIQVAASLDPNMRKQYFSIANQILNGLTLKQVISALKTRLDTPESIEALTLELAKVVSDTKQGVELYRSKRVVNKAKIAARGGSISHEREYDLICTMLDSTVILREAKDDYARAHHNQYRDGMDLDAMLEYIISRLDATPHGAEYEAEQRAHFEAYNNAYHSAYNNFRRTNAQATRGEPLSSASAHSTAAAAGGGRSSVTFADKRRSVARSRSSSPTDSTSRSRSPGRRSDPKKGNRPSSPSSTKRKTEHWCFAHGPNATHDSPGCKTMRDYQFFFSEEMRSATSTAGPLVSRIKEKITVQPGKGADALAKYMDKK
jgi:hypothetical protein